MDAFIAIVLPGLLSRLGYQMARSPVLPIFAADLGCVYRKLRFGRIDDAVRRPWHATRCVRSAEPGGRLADKTATRYSHRVPALRAISARTLRNSSPFNE